MTRGARMGNEVGRLAAPLSRICGCPTCGIGIAIDAVGDHWGEPPYDWGLKREGHDKICSVSRDGLTPEQDRRARDVILKFYAAERQELPGVDARLPPETEDDLH